MLQLSKMGIVLSHDDLTPKMEVWKEFIIKYLIYKVNNDYLKQELMNTQKENKHIPKLHH